MSSTLKAVIALGCFDEQGETAKKIAMGSAIRDAVALVLSTHNAAMLVDRSNLDDILFETELQLSGLADSATAVSVGKILNAEAIFSGSVTERADDLYVTLSLVKLETAEIFSENFAVPRSVFSADASKRLDMLYVSPMGIEISLKCIGITSIGEEPFYAPFEAEGATYLRRNAGVEVRYRVRKWLMAGIGIDWLYGAVWHSDNVLWGMPDGYPPPLTAGGPFTVYPDGFAIPITVQFVWNPIRSLALDAGFTAAYCLLNFSGIFNPSQGRGFGINDFGPQLQAEFAAFTILGGVEVFITPRLSLGLSAGYSFGGTRLSIETLWHLRIGTNPLLAEIPVNVEGLSYSASVSMYF